MNVPLRLVAPLLLALTSSGCMLFAGKPVDPMPTLTIPARVPSADARVVVVLPGRGDDLEGLQASGIAEAIQRGDPSAQVVLVGATMTYYMDGGLVRRLHEQVMAPIRASGAREIWVAGASMGGMGAMLYEHRHPGEVSGLLLMAPFMGDAGLIREIAAAGGVDRWDPGPPPAQVTRDNVAREQWRMVRQWSQDPRSARRIWLVCGNEDRFIGAARMIDPALPRGHFVERPGGHAWTVWNEGAADVFRRLD